MSGNEALDTSTVIEEETDFEAAFKEHAEAKETAEVEVDDVIDDGKLEDELEPKNQDDEPGDDDIKPTEEDEAIAGMSDEDKAIYAELPDAAKARMLAIEKENKDLNHRLKSDAGRVSAFQVKINGLEKQIQNISKSDTTGDQPDKKQIAEAMGGTDEEWETFKEDYPEVAKAIDSRLDKAGQATQESIDNTLAPVKEMQDRNVEQQATDAKQAAVQAVAETYPNWTEAVQKPEFALWLDSQPPGVQSLSQSNDPQDASVLVGMYDGHLVAEGLPTLKADPKDNGVDTEEKLAQEEKTNSVAARRKQQLEDGATIPSKNARVDPSDDGVDDFEAAFNYHAKRKDRQRQGA